MTILEHDWFPLPVPHNVRIGVGSWLYSSFSLIHCRSRHADAVVIGDHSGVYIGTMFDLGPQGRVQIGDYCAIAGPIINTNADVIIGDYSLISYSVVIADSEFATPVADDTAPAQVQGVVIGDNTWIGARATILGGSVIGEGAIIGAATVVTGEVPPFAILAGDPARIVGWAPPAGHR